jgi:hypothetical protein
MAVCDHSIVPPHTHQSVVIHALPAMLHDVLDHSFIVLSLLDHAPATLLLATLLVFQRDSMIKLTCSTFDQKSCAVSTVSVYFLQFMAISRRSQGIFQAYGHAEQTSLLSNMFGDDHRARDVHIIVKVPGERECSRSVSLYSGGSIINTAAVGSDTLPARIAIAFATGPELFVDQNRSRPGRQ